MNEPPLHHRYPRLWGAYHALADRLGIEPIPGYLLDRRLLNNEFVRLYDLAQDAGVDVRDILEEAVR
ncbi:MAG: hypothetical protein ACO3O3_08095 [Ilumatobacteraceae bacterium]